MSIKELQEHIETFEDKILIYYIEDIDISSKPSRSSLKHISDLILWTVSFWNIYSVTYCHKGTYISMSLGNSKMG